MSVWRSSIPSGAMFLRKERSVPPGPTGLGLLRAFVDARRDLLGFLSAMRDDYGDVSRYKIPGYQVYVLSAPDDVQHVLQDNHKNYRKAETYESLRPTLGNGLLLSEGGLWLRQRRLVAPLFHRKRVAGYVDIMVDETRRAVAQLERLAQTNQTVDVSALMSRVTLSLVGRILFGRDLGASSDAVGDALQLLMRDANRRIMSPVAMPLWVPTPANSRALEAIETLDRLVQDMIERRRGRHGEFDDLLSMLLEAEDADTGQRMSDTQVRDELMTFVLAGHETTSNALGWTLKLLAEHPDIRRRLQAKVDAGWALDGDDVVGQLAGLDYLDMVLDESMRMYPPAWTIEREPIDDDHIGGYTIEAGSVVITAPYLVHHHPKVWRRPETFDPERFGPERKKDHHRYAHFPFGGGPRMCVGADFAMLEAKIILAEITRRVELDLVAGHTVRPEANVTLHPQDGMMMEVRRR